MPAKENKALIFDVDGTLADTEAAHLKAFNQAFAQTQMGWHWSESEYRRLLKISGGKERILYYWQQLDPVVHASASGTMQTVARIHACKTECYEALVSGGQLPLRPGVLDLITLALNRGLRLAIATTTTPDNIDALLRTPMGADWKKYFSVIEDASTAPKKKPDPQVYLQVLDRLQTRPEQTLAFEDSENGLLAATSVGIATIVTPTKFTEAQDFSSAFRVLPNLTEMQPLLAQWIAGQSLR